LKGFGGNAERSAVMTSRTFSSSFRLPAGLLLGGQLLYIVVTQFHPGIGETATNQPAVFAEYAASGSWTAVHAGQFAAMAVLLAGLFGLYFALEAQAGHAGWFARFGAGMAVTALVLYGALQAIDGVANKQVDLAWVNAPATEKAVRFASAEAVRWVEWGMRSYHDFALGLALLLFAAAVVREAPVPRPIGYLMGLSGLASLVQGWVVGSEGFSQTESIAIIVTWVLSLAWMIWLVIVAWRMQSNAPPPGR
jgi:hypothetical protein